MPVTGKAAAFALRPADIKRMARAHPDLKKVVMEAARITTIPFTILQADRTIEQQRQNVAKGVSWTMDSRHLIDAKGLVYAVDIAPLVDGKVTWSWPVYHKLAPIMKKAAANVGVPVGWGGDWKKTPDGPHWELDRKRYPAAKK